MTIQLGDTAPDFTAETTEGKVSLHEYLGDGWGILFSHPADFTPVCTTELGDFARRKDEFAERNTKLIGVSVDSVESHPRLVKRHRRNTRTGAQLPAHRR
jgi:peroxiredoxin (alkyl hydroperoxide reductase subunit C)